MLYGGNANFYHIAPSEYESVLGQLAEIAAADTLVIPSAGPSYGVMMDQAEILKGTAYPTVMVLPHQGITTSQGVVAGLRHFAQKVGKPIVLYIKYDDYISVEGAQELVDEGLVSWIKYAIVREDPANDPYLAQLIDVVDPALIVSGIGEQPVIEHLVDFGVNGFTAGCVCIRPELSDQLLKAVQAKDLTPRPRDPGHLQASRRPAERHQPHPRPPRGGPPRRHRRHRAGPAAVERGDARAGDADRRGGKSPPLRLNLNGPTRGSYSRLIEPIAGALFAGQALTS